MTATGPLFYVFFTLTIIGIAWALKQQLSWETRSRRRRRKNHCKVVNTAKRPTVTFLVRAR